MSEELQRALDDELTAVERLDVPYQALAEAVYDADAETLAAVIAKVLRRGERLVEARRLREGLEGLREG